MPLANRNILVGVTGGIATFKSVTLVRELLRQGAQVRVAMTPSAMQFVGPITFSAITGHPCITELWDPTTPGEVHVELGHWANAIVIAPATMNAIARYAHGLADDVVLATLACFEGPVLMAPAMHTRMWNQPSTRDNLEVLRSRGVDFVGPADGALASGESGMGRMAEPEEIVAAAARTLGSRSDLAGLRVLVTAGPTLEDIDPVRFIGNRSSGRMGFALAARAAARGADVCLIAGPVTLETPRAVQRVDARSAVEMRDAVVSRQGSVDVIVMAAAVGDFRPSVRHTEKLKKSDDDMTLRLERNPDILAELGQARRGARPVLVGFAVETEDLVGYARRKLEQKRVDLVVANLAADGFGGDSNRAVLVDRETHEHLPTSTKQQLADRILDRVGRMVAAEPTPLR